MAFLDLVNTRRSVRRYDPERPVDRALLDSCLEAARMAPSACNAQPYRFVVVDEPELRDRVAEATYGRLVSFNRFATRAGAFAVIVAEESSFVPKLGGLLKDTRYSLMDIGIAAEHFCLQAAELGLGTCMLGWFDENRLRELLAVPTSRRIALVITVGYEGEADVSKGESGTRSRKPLGEMRSYNTYR